MLERRKGLVPLRSTQRTRAASEVAWVCVLEDSREGKRVPFFEGEPLRLREWAMAGPGGGVGCFGAQAWNRRSTHYGLTLSALR